jgi:hypothetical protein
MALAVLKARFPNATAFGNTLRGTTSNTRVCRTRHVEGVGRAHQQGENEQVPDLHPVGRQSQGEKECEGEHGHLGDGDDPLAVEAVSQHARHRSSQQARQPTDTVDATQDAAGPGDVVDHPAHGGLLDPHRRRGEGIAQPEEPETGNAQSVERAQARLGGLGSGWRVAGGH